MASGDELDLCKGGFQSSGGGSPFGPVIATDAGFVALTPAHPLFCEPLLWSSADGFVWELVSDESPFGDGAFIRDIAERDGRFVATGGFDWDEGAVWVSGDGLTWERADVELDYAGTIAAGDLGWMLTGLVGMDDAPWTNHMWFSTDGLTWDGPHERPDGLATGYFPPQLAVGSEIIFGVGDRDRISVCRIEEGIMRTRESKFTRGGHTRTILIICNDSLPPPTLHRSAHNLHHPALR